MSSSSPDNRFDPNAAAFNQRFQAPNSNGFNQLNVMGSMNSSPPPQQQQQQHQQVPQQQQQQQPSNFSFSNYQSVMKQVHTPDGGPHNYNPSSMNVTPQFSPQTQSFNFPTLNSFQNAGFNQPQAPRSPGSYSGSPATPSATAGPGMGPGPTIWASQTPPASPFPNSPGPMGGFTNPFSQFVQQGGPNLNQRNPNQFNKMNSNQQFNRNYGVNNYNNY